MNERSNKFRYNGSAVDALYRARDIAGKVLDSASGDPSAERAAKEIWNGIYDLIMEEKDFSDRVEVRQVGTAWSCRADNVLLGIGYKSFDNAWNVGVRYLQSKDDRSKEVTKKIRVG